MEEALHLSDIGSSAFHDPSLSILAKKHFVRIIRLAEIPSPRTILEYLRLGNLEDQHAQERVTDQESAIILCRSLDASTSVHGENIVHRDIKPENSLVCSQRPHCM